MKHLSGLVLFCALAAPAGAQNAFNREPLGIGLESVVYPRVVRFLPLQNGGEDVRMAYQDADLPVGARRERRTPVLLLHGKNFGGYYWGSVIDSLNEAGFRVIVPDQIGFGKSSKPDILYSFDMLADNTVKLLDELKISQVIVVGHSMGGMLATHLATRFPGRIEKLVLEDPIGLEDYGAATGKVSLGRIYADELKDTDATSIRAFYQRYFVTWKPEFEYLPQIRARVTRSGEYPRWAKSSARTYQTILEQPVVGEFSQIRVPTLLVIGQEDHTIVGKNYMPAEAVGRFGNYRALVKRVAKEINGAQLVEIANVGHIPHLEAPKAFEDALLKFLLPH